MIFNFFMKYNFFRANSTPGSCRIDDRVDTFAVYQYDASTRHGVRDALLVKAPFIFNNKKIHPLGEVSLHNDVGPIGYVPPIISIMSRCSSRLRRPVGT